MPVDSMSTRVLMGMVQAFVHPGIWRCRFISATSSSREIVRASGHTGARTDLTKPGAQLEYHRGTRFLRHSALGRRRTVVSTMVIGAGSVGLSARPTLPNTE